MATMYNPATPGELLREFLGHNTINDLTDHIGVSRATVSRVLNGHTAVTVDLSIRLGQALGLSLDFFSRAQLQYDHWIESQKKRPKIKPLTA
ncbi:MAG: HigA family addiction module antitoxin [Terracidiphilus sp.]|nr:HigA family addiction module antitoxin [Terracidiphilus sp.]